MLIYCPPSGDLLIWICEIMKSVIIKMLSIVHIPTFATSSKKLVMFGVNMCFMHSVVCDIIFFENALMYRKEHLCLSSNLIQQEEIVGWKEKFLKIHIRHKLHFLWDFLWAFGNVKERVGRKFLDLQFFVLKADSNFYKLWENISCWKSLQFFCQIIYFLHS